MIFSSPFQRQDFSFALRRLKWRTKFTLLSTMSTSVEIVPYLSISLVRSFRIEKFPLGVLEVTGVLVCDSNGLVVSSLSLFAGQHDRAVVFLADKDVSVSPGPVVRLTELANSLSGQRATVCLERDER